MSPTSTNGGSSWTRPLAFWDAWGGCFDATFNGASNAWVLLGQANGFNGIARTTNGGVSWSVAEGAAAGLPPRYTWKNRAPVAIVAPSAAVVLATIHGALQRSIDGGATWTVVDSSTLYGDLLLDKANPSIVYAYSRLGIHRSANAGATWELMAGSPKLPPGDFDGTNESRLALAANSDLYATRYTARATGGTDGGLWHLRAGVWTQIWGSAQAQFAFDVALDPTNANRIAIVTNDNPWHDRMGSSGVWLSTNGGTSFSQQNTNLPMNRGGTIAFDPVTSGKLIVGLNGRGFWTARF